MEGRIALFACVAGDGVLSERIAPWQGFTISVTILLDFVTLFVKSMIFKGEKESIEKGRPNSRPSLCDFEAGSDLLGFDLPDLFRVLFDRSV